MRVPSAGVNSELMRGGDAVPELKYTVSDVLQVSLSGSAGIRRNYCQT